MSLSPRLVAIQGIEFTPIQIAVQGLLDYIAQGGKLGGRSSNRLKLQKIVDAKVFALHSKLSTKVRSVRAVGVVVSPQAPAQAAAVTCLSSRVRRRGAHARAFGSAISQVSGGRATSGANGAMASGGSAASCFGGVTTTAAGVLGATSGASVTVRGELHTSSTGAAAARGQRNLSNTELAAVVAVVRR